MIITELVAKDKTDKTKAEIISPFLCLCQFRSQVSGMESYQKFYQERGFEVQHNYTEAIQLLTLL